MVYENVKRLCEEQGLTISSLEKLAKLGNGTIGGWKTSAPRVDNLQSVAKVLKTTVDALLKEKKG